MALPKALRRLTPERLKNDPRLRAAALKRGLIPPRPMHSAAESQLLATLAADRQRAVEIGVYEGSSAVVIAKALPVSATFHLVDPYIETALHPGWRGTETATRAVLERATAERGGPELRWHVALSWDAGRDWSGPIDFLFIDGDHSEEGCRRDWDMWHGFVEPGGVVAFHDAREGKPDGWGLPGPTKVVDDVFRPQPPDGWAIEHELDTLVVVRRQA